jgi:hypothetical protein
MNIPIITDLWTALLEVNAMFASLIGSISIQQKLTKEIATSEVQEAAATRPKNLSNT